jgi:hypothetical protein
MDFCYVTFRLLQNISASSTELNHTTSQNSIHTFDLLYFKSYVVIGLTLCHQNCIILENFCEATGPCVGFK